MKNILKKAVIFVPFWGQTGHVGCNRVDRFVRWLSEDGYSIIIVRAGDSEGERSQPWGKEITVRDRMGLYSNDATVASCMMSHRKPNKYRRALAYWLFNPDPTIIWARAAARHPAVLQAMDNVAFILSSSPPESAHVGAWMLSRRMNVPHIVDMRDGWMDEPLKPILHSSKLRRWLEGRTEKRILRNAKSIQVTSEVWHELLLQRISDINNKVHILTNAYPQNFPEIHFRKLKENSNDLVLIHAGRFIGSRSTQVPNILFEPLFQHLSLQAIKKGVIYLIGSLSAIELQMIDTFKLPFQKIGWRIEWLGYIPRDQVLGLLQQADGLLILSASYAAIPSKFFEYIPTEKPIFVVTEKESATWRLGKKLKQAILVEIGKQYDNYHLLFPKSITEKICYSTIPEEYTENRLKSVFLKICNDILQ